MDSAIYLLACMLTADNTVKLASRKSAALALMCAAISLLVAIKWAIFSTTWHDPAFLSAFRLVLRSMWCKEQIAHEYRAKQLSGVAIMRRATRAIREGTASGIILATMTAELCTDVQTALVIGLYLVITMPVEIFVHDTLNDQHHVIR